MKTFTPRLARYAHLPALLVMLGIAGCTPTANDKALAAQEVDKQSVCSLDGMALVEYPGPKAQILYEGQESADFFCDTVELFHTVLLPEQVKRIRAVFVQDMGKANWDKPEGNWFDARTGYFVFGSKRTGSMGPTIASFAQESDAQAFIRQWGGRLLKFSQVTADMVDLSGGALHDSKM